MLFRSVALYIAPAFADSLFPYGECEIARSGHVRPHKCRQRSSRNAWANWPPQTPPFPTDYDWHGPSGCRSSVRSSFHGNALRLPTVPYIAFAQQPRRRYRSVSDSSDIRSGRSPNPAACIQPNIQAQKMAIAEKTIAIARDMGKSLKTNER